MTEAVAAKSREPLRCSFCGKSQHEVRKLIAGPTVFICDECVELCNDITRECGFVGKPSIDLMQWALERAIIIQPHDALPMADQIIRWLSNPPPRDSDGSGEAGETGTGSTEGDSAGRETASPNLSPKETNNE